MATSCRAILLLLLGLLLALCSASFGATTDTAAALSLPLTRLAGAVAPSTSRSTRYRRFDNEAGVSAVDAATAVEAPLSGCWQTSFSVGVRIGSQQFALRLDTTSAALAVATRDCAGCHYVSPLYAPAGSTTAVSTGASASERYPDGSEWRGEVFRDSVSLVSAVGDQGLPMRLAAIRQVTSSRGLFFPSGTCADPGAATSVPLQGIAGLGPRALTAAAPPTDSLWSKLRESHPAWSDQLSIQMCVSTGRVWFGAGVARAGAANQDSQQQLRAHYTGRMRYTPMVRTHEGVYGLALQSLSVQDGTDSVGSPIPFLAGEGQPRRAVLDSSSSFWQLPPATFRELTSRINSHALFARLFHGDVFWSPQQDACAPLPLQEGGFTTPAELDRALPRIVLRMTDGLQVSLGAIGSYLVPCDPLLRTWAPGIVPGLRDQPHMILGWPFLNHFLVQFDVGASLVGFGAIASSPTATGGDASCDSAWTAARGGPALIRGGIVGACGSGGGEAPLDDRCGAVEASLVSDPAAPPSPTQCAGVDPAALDPGVEGGSCAGATPLDGVCNLACAAGFTAQLSRPYRCALATGASGATLAHGVQSCTPLRWLQPAPPVAGSDGSPAAAFLGGHTVQLQWELPALVSNSTFPRRWSVLLHSGGLDLDAPARVLLGPVVAPLQAGPSTPLTIRLPNPARPAVYFVQAMLDDEAWGSVLRLPLLPGDGAASEEDASSSTGPASQDDSTSTAAAGSDAGVSSSTGAAQPPSSSSSTGLNDASGQDGSSSSTGAHANGDSSSSSTGSDSSGVDLPLAALVQIDTKHPYPATSGDEASYRAQLLLELEQAVGMSPGRVAPGSLRTTRSKAGFVTVEFVLLPLAHYSAAEPSVDELVARLVAQAAAPASALHAGPLGSSVTSVSASMIRACDDGGYRRSCSSDGDNASKNNGSVSPRAWVLGLVLGLLAAALLIIAICVCRRRCMAPSAGAHSKLRQQDDAAAPTAVHPGPAGAGGSGGGGDGGSGGSGHGSSGVQMSKLAGAGAQPFSIVSGDDDDALLDMEEMMDEDEDDEALPTRDDLDHVALEQVQLDSPHHHATDAHAHAHVSHAQPSDIESQVQRGGGAVSDRSRIDPPSRILSAHDYHAQRHYEQDEDELALEEDDDLNDL